MRLARVLAIAGNDQSGAAGIQADLKTCTALGTYGLGAMTVLVNKNTVQIKNIQQIPASFVKEQIQTIFEDIEVDAIKLGMLYSGDVMLAVKEVLAPLKHPNVVLDPVMVVTTGEKLSKEDAVDILVNELIPLARLITPNVPEAETLLGEKLDNQECLPEAAKRLSKKLGGKISVLLKAGHFEDPEIIDVFYNAETDETLKLVSPRIYTTNTIGTGCTFSSAIAAYLARGEELNSAVIKAKEYLAGAVEAGAHYTLGAPGGCGPIHHFWNIEHWGEDPLK